MAKHGAKQKQYIETGVHAIGSAINASLEMTDTS